MIACMFVTSEFAAGDYIPCTRQTLPRSHTWPTCTQLVQPTLHTGVNLIHDQWIPVEPVGLLDTKWPLALPFSATFWFMLFTDALSGTVLQNSTLWTSMQRRRRVFTSRPYTHKRGLCCRPVSIRLSVTFVYCIQAAEDIVKLLSRPGSPS